MSKHMTELEAKALEVIGTQSLAALTVHDLLVAVGAVAADKDPASYVYGLMRGLEKAGALKSHETEHGNPKRGGRPRILYTRTDAGERALRRHAKGGEAMGHAYALRWEIDRAGWDEIFAETKP